MLRPTSIRFFGLCALALYGGLAGVASGEEDGQKSPTQLAAKADQVLREMSDHLRGLRSFTSDATWAFNMRDHESSQTVTFQYAFPLQVRRPNKFSMVWSEMSGDMHLALVCDGRSVFSYSPGASKYFVTSAPKTLDGLRGEMLLGGAGIGIRCLVADDPYKTAMEDIKKIEYLGLVDVDGTRCHQLKFYLQITGTECVASIQEGPTPLLRKVFIDVRPPSQTTTNAFSGVERWLVVTFDNWSLNPDLADERFAFTPPEGVSQEGPHPLVGKAAPNLKLDLLDGGQMDLASYRGKSVVVLDFWATWCRPCRQALPILTEVTEAYKDKGVVFIAVNERERPKTIKAFVEQNALKCMVALDRDGKAGELYGVEGIPQTVLIGKDGKVQVVHVGFSPGLKTKLPEELDALVAGKNLSAQAASQR